MNANPEALSSASRQLTRIVAVLFTLLGVILFVAPNWAASNFAWKISPFVAMTMGGWYLGSAFYAWESARLWRWPVAYGCLLYLWVFSVLEAGLLVVHRERLILNAVFAWPYMVTLAVATVAAVAGALDWARIRPRMAAEGVPVPIWVRAMLLALAVFVFFLAFVGPGSFGLDGSIFPEPLTPFTVGGFAVFYFSLGVAAVALAWARGLAPIVPYLWGGLALIIPITVAAFVYLNQFDFTARPGGLLYFGAYIAAFVGAVLILAYERRQRVAAAPGRAVTGGS